FNPSGDSPADRLAALDEVLQVMYWLRGERLATSVRAADLTRWVGLRVGDVESLLRRLAASDWVCAVDSGGEPRYQLTEPGVREGGRRFGDEFADLTRPGHGECGNPDCDCHLTGDPADCAHGHRPHWEV